MIVTESVIDAAALWIAGLRNVIPVYGVTGLTEEIMAHLVECRVKCVVLLLDADDVGHAAAIDMGQRLAAVNIETRSVELPAKDAAEFIAGGGLVDELRTLITERADSSSADASAARAVRAEASGAAALPGAMMQLETSNDGSMLFTVEEREYRVRGLSPMGLERLRVNVRLTLNGNFHLDTIDLYQARARSLFAQSAAKLCGALAAALNLLRFFDNCLRAGVYGFELPVLNPKRTGC